MKTTLLPAAIPALGLALLSTSSQAFVFYADDFSTDFGTDTTLTSGFVADPERVFRVYESEIDDGWLRRIGNGSYPTDPIGGDATGVPGQWFITNGRAENSSTIVDGGWQGSPSESPLVQFWTNPIAGDPVHQPQLEISFDYNVASGDTLYAHFWAVTGTSDFDGQFISNIEGTLNGNVNNTNDSDELTTYNLLDGSVSKGGSATAISGALTGTGTFSTAIDIPGLGIPGVSSVGDIQYFYIGFAKDEDGLAGITWIDNFTLAVPEPSRVVLLGLGLGLVASRRRRPRSR